MKDDIEQRVICNLIQKCFQITSLLYTKYSSHWNLLCNDLLEKTMKLHRQLWSHIVGFYCTCVTCPKERRGYRLIFKSKIFTDTAFQEVLPSNRNNTFLCFLGNNFCGSIGNNLSSLCHLNFPHGITQEAKCYCG